MGNKKPSLEQTRAYIRNLNNPYASLSIDMAFDAVETHNAASRDKEKHAYLKKLQDPYATHAIFEDQETSADSSIPSQTQPVLASDQCKLSKKDFQSQCRRIFLQYVPAEEGNTLRTHHRDFITRNESRTAQVRFLLAAELRKYDLSAGQNIRPRFNRERDALTKEKLQKIEREIEK